MTSYTDEPYCKYSNTLRAMFTRINPYSFSCVYKHMFEQHAVETLGSCEVDSLDVVDTYMYHMDAFHIVDSLGCDQDDDTGWNYPWTSDRDTYKEKTFLEQLYENIHMEQDSFPVLTDTGGTGPWTLCSHCQQPYFYSYMQDRCTDFEDASTSRSRPCSTPSTPIPPRCQSSPVYRPQRNLNSTLNKCSSAPRSQAPRCDSTESTEDDVKPQESDISCEASSQVKYSKEKTKKTSVKVNKASTTVVNKKPLSKSCTSGTSNNVTIKKRHKPPHVQPQVRKSTTTINIVTQKQLLETPKFTQNMNSGNHTTSKSPINDKNDRVPPKKGSNTHGVYMSFGKKEIAKKSLGNAHNQDDKAAEKKEPLKTWKVSGTNDSFPFPGKVKLNKRIPYQPPHIQYKDEASLSSYRYYPDWRCYMQQYREVYTDKNLRRPMLGLYPDKLQMLRAREIVTKATVECMDVRDGACIKPCPPMRLTEFTFDINSRLRTDMFMDTQTLAMKQKWPSRSCSDPSTSPDRATSDQASSHDEVTGFIPPKSQNFQYPVDSWSGPSCSTNAVMGIARSNSQRNSQLPTIQLGGAISQLGGLQHNTLVSRSRPSIPSNARGVVCPSAVETPVHVIAVHTANGVNHTGRSNESLRSISPTVNSLGTSTSSSNISVE